MKRCFGCFELIKDELEVCPFCGYIEGTPAEEAVHMNPGTVISERYTIGKVLGYGGFGVTYIGWDNKLQQKVAIKEYLPSDFSTRMPGQTEISVMSGQSKEQFRSGLKKFIQEAKRLSLFQKEDGIVRIFDCIEENDTAYIIMEYIEGESLSDKLRRENILSEQTALGIMMPVMKSLEEVHRAGIIHRDIAPDNILITADGRVKLIDFGASRYATADEKDPKSLTVIIKPGYSAEEQYRSRGEQGPYTDVYSVAATLYRMLTGQVPPDSLERRAKIENTNKDPLIPPRKLNKEISPVTENAILNALNIMIEDRTPDMGGFISDLTSEDPVKRKNGRIKKVKKNKVPLFIKIVVPLLLAIIGVTGVLIYTGVIDFKSLFRTDVAIPDGYTEVPNVEGMDIESAVETLRDNELDYVTGGSVVSEYVDADLIVLQSPEEGKLVQEDTRIELTISRGTGEVKLPENGISTVPSFLWLEEEEALEDFDIAGLTVLVKHIYDENVTLGQVISATDEEDNELSTGDELPEGSRIILYVSGEEELSLSDVTVLHYGDHSYACFYGCDTWEEASDFCNNTDGYLASVTTSEENDALVELIDNGAFNYGYIGYREQDGIWQWADGEYSEYTNWNAGEPSQINGNEHYAVITEDGTWSAGDFSSQSDDHMVCFICEWDYYVEGGSNIDYYELMADSLLDSVDAGNGAITVSLFWSSGDDLDLHMFTPNGSEICYYNREAQGGYLDVDANAGIIVDNPVENIYFDAPEPGTYSVYIYDFSDRSDTPSDYAVRVNIGNQSQMFEGTIEGYETIDIITFEYGGDYITSISQITPDCITRMQEAAIDVFYAQTSFETDKVIKNLACDGMFFISEGDGLTGYDHNRCYIVLRANAFNDDVGSFDQYFYVSFSNLILLDDGSVSVSVDDFEYPYGTFAVDDYHYYCGYSDLDSLYSTEIAPMITNYGYDYESTYPMY